MLSSLSLDDDDVYRYYLRWRLKLEGETENTGVCTKERKGITAEVLMATPCTNSLERRWVLLKIPRCWREGESGGVKHDLSSTKKKIKISLR